MCRSRILVRTLFVFILLTGLITGFFLPTLIFVDAAPVQQAVSPTDCLGTTITEWTFDGITTPSTGSGMFSYGTGSGLSGSTFITGYSDQAVSFKNWTTSSSLDPNDYVEFDVNTQGRNSIKLSFEYRSTNTGPTKLDFYYSTDGTNFSLQSSSNTMQNDSNWHSLSFNLT